MTTDEQPNAVVTWLKGRKTYAVALTILACGVLEWQGVHIPELAWAALAAFGLGFLRAGVQKAQDDERV